MKIQRYTRNGMGSMAGGDWRDARRFAALEPDLRLAEPADRFLVGFDRDREDPIFWSTTQAKLTRSGSPAKPITIAAGYIGHEDDVQTMDPQSSSACLIHSGLTQLRRAAPVMTGEPCFAVANGIHHVRLDGFVFQGAADAGFIRFEQKEKAGIQISQSLSLKNLHGHHVGRVIETQRGTRLLDVEIADCSAFGVTRGFARFRSIDRSTLRRLVIDGGGVDGGGENVCQMLAFESGSQVRLESIYLTNAVNMLGTGGERRRSSYVQGDGIVCEKDTVDFHFKDCHASAMGDGGFDLKSRNFSMLECSAMNCKFGIRIWSEGPNTIERSVVHNPRPAGSSHGACIWFAGKADLVDCELRCGPGSAVFQSGEGGAGAPVLRMHGGAITTEGNLPLLVGSGSGTVELNQVTVNGQLRSETLRL